MMVHPEWSVELGSQHLIWTLKMATEKEIANLGHEWKSTTFDKWMKNWQKSSQDRNPVLSIQSFKDLEKEGLQHNKKVQELKISYQKSLTKGEIESSSSHSTKSFSSHYNRIQLEEFKEMQMHLRDSVKKELLRKISNPCLLFRQLEVNNYNLAGQSSVLEQLCKGPQGSEFCCQWSKTKILILIDIETGYWYIHESKEIQYSHRYISHGMKLPYGLSQLESSKRFVKHVKITTTMFPIRLCHVI